MNLFAVLTILFLVTPAFASEQGGQEIFRQQCSSCHGMNGISSNNYIPNLACQKEGYIKKQLYNFKTWRRAHSVMKHISKSLSASDVDQLAKFIASIPCGGEQAADLSALCAKKTKDKQACLACCFELQAITEINACTSTCDVQQKWLPGEVFPLKD